MPWEQDNLAEPLQEGKDLLYSNPAYLLAFPAAAQSPEPPCADSNSSEAQPQEACRSRNSASAAEHLIGFLKIANCNH